MLYEMNVLLIFLFSSLRLAFNIEREEGTRSGDEVVQGGEKTQ